MKKLIVSTTVVFLLSFSNFAGFSNGTWGKPFHPGVGNTITNAQSTGNYLWFITDNGIGRLNTISQAAIFFSYSSLNLGANEDPTEISIAVGDSNHVAFFYDDGADVAYCYDGTAWKMVTFPSRSAITTIDKFGNLWTVPDDTFQMVKFYDGQKWKTISPGIPDSSQITSMIADSSGVIWFSYNLHNNFSFNAGLGRYDRLSDSLVIFDSLYFKQMTLDPNNNIWLIGDTLMYSVSKDLKITSYPISTESRYSKQCIDTDGNLWRSTIDDMTTNVTKVGTPYSVLWKYDYLSYHNPLNSCNNGVYIATRDGFIYHKNNGTNSTFIPLDSLWGDVCGDIERILLFKKDGSIVYSLKNYSESTGNDSIIIESKNGHCRRFPVPDKSRRLVSIYEMTDGTLVASFDNSARGLYRLNGSTWELLSGTENIFFGNITVDSKEKIWSILDTKIIHQTNSGWELIDSSNSNLPAFGQNGAYGSTSFKEDSDGAMWALLGSSVVKTSDGYNWTVYNAANSIIPNIKNSTMYVNTNGNVQLISANLAEISRATFANGKWNLELIKLPADIYTQAYVGQDSWGNIYARSVGLLYYYDISDSTWTRLDSTSIPYNLKYFIGDDKKGMFYFKDAAFETIVFDHNGTSAQYLKNNVSVKSSLVAQVFSSGIILVDYNLPKSDKLSLKVFSLDGRLVKTLFSGFEKKGTFHKSFNSGLPQGVYIVRLKTSDKSQVTRVVLR
jgi:hypothetical protein